MKRVALLLAISGLMPLVVAPASDAGTFTADVYRSHFLARDRNGVAYSVDAVVEDRPGGTQLVLEVRRRCKACRAEVYVRELGPGDFALVPPVGVTECVCMGAFVHTKFGGKELRIEWRWDLEQDGGPAGDGYEWVTVTANNLMNVSCFGTGTYTATPDPLSGEAPQRPKGAQPFPKEMPRGFQEDIMGSPGCHVESP